jgi:hypothetical protein
MPQGLVRSGDFRNGTPITLPHVFGNLVGEPEPFGNNEPQANATLDSNPVTWVPTPNHFGNQVSFSLQTVPPVLLVAPGATGSTDINLTNLLGISSAALTFSGAPTGVTVAFAPNPDTTTSIATVTVGSAVPAGRYTITVFGTVASPNIEYTYIHLVVVAGATPPPPTGATFLVGIAAEAESGNNATTAGVDTTGANFIAAIVGSNGGNAAASTVTDSLGNTWTQLPTAPAGNFSTPVMFYTFATSVGSNHTFKAQNGSSSAFSIAIAAFSGVSAFEAGTSQTSLDNAGSPSPHATTQPGSTSPASIGDLIISGIGGYFPNDGPATVVSVDSGFTIGAGVAGTQLATDIAYKLADTGDVASGSNPTWTVTDGTNRISSTIAVFSA